MVFIKNRKEGLRKFLQPFLCNRNARVCESPYPTSAGAEAQLPRNMIVRKRRSMLYLKKYK